MTKKAAQQAKEPVVENINPSKPDIPVTLATPEGTVVVFGQDLVGQKEIDLLYKCLTFKDGDNSQHYTRMVNFTPGPLPMDTDGSEMRAICAPDVRGIALNLHKIFEESVKNVLEHPTVSVYAAYHRQIFECILHERHHLTNFIIGTGSTVDKWSKEALDAEEEAAILWSWASMVKMAKSINVEPSIWQENAYFCHIVSKWLKQLAESGKDSDKKLAAQQEDMLNNRLFMKIEEASKFPAHSFKVYMECLDAKDKDTYDEKSWQKQTVEGASSIESTIAAVAEELPSVAAPLPSNVIGGEEALYNDDDSGDDGYWDEDAVMDYNPEPVQQYVQPPVQQVQMAQPAPQVYVAQAQPQQPAPQQTAPQAAPQQYSPPQAALKPTGYPDEYTAQIVLGFYLKAAQHIWANCGPLMNSDVAFANPEAVAAVPVQISPEEAQIIFAYDCVDEQGKYHPQVPTANGMFVRGLMSKKGNLPNYRVYINNNGRQLCRVIMPQNPAKPGQYNGFSKQAVRTRNGEQIFYIFEGDQSIKNQPGAQNMLWKVENGKLIKTS